MITPLAAIAIATQWRVADHRQAPLKGLSIILAERSGLIKGNLTDMVKLCDKQSLASQVRDVLQTGKVRVSTMSDFLEKEQHAYQGFPQYPLPPSLSVTVNCMGIYVGGQPKGYACHAEIELQYWVAPPNNTVTLATLSLWRQAQAYVTTTQHAQRDTARVLARLSKNLAQDITEANKKEAWNR